MEDDSSTCTDGSDSSTFTDSSSDLDSDYESEGNSDVDMEDQDSPAIVSLSELNRCSLPEFKNASEEDHPEIVAGFCEQIDKIKVKNKLNTETDLAVCKAVLNMFPSITPEKDGFQLQQLKSLAAIVNRFVGRKKKSTPQKDASSDQDLQLVAETILQAYPSRPFFHLMTRWGRRRKLSFHGDMLNTLLVICSQFDQCH